MVAAVPQPNRPDLHAEGIPQDMKVVKRWVAWRYEWRDGRLTKNLYQAAKPSRQAKSNDPKTWGTFQQAYAAYQHTRDLAGIGFVLGDGWVGVDLDHVIAPDGSIASWATDVLTHADSYTEVSPSGTGFHVIARGDLPADGRVKDFPQDGQKLEMYDSGKFFTVTGNVWSGRATVQDRAEALHAIHARYIARPMRIVEARQIAPVALDDEALIAKACATNPRFAALWQGDISEYDNDQSRADGGLCGHLAFWTGKDADQMDRLIRQWCLFRDKWDSRRGGQTYGERTIAGAIEHCANVYCPRSETPQEPEKPAEPVSVPENATVEMLRQALAKANAMMQEEARRRREAERELDWVYRTVAVPTKILGPSEKLVAIAFRKTLNEARANGLADEEIRVYPKSMAKDTGLEDGTVGQKFKKMSENTGFIDYRTTEPDRNKNGKFFMQSYAAPGKMFDVPENVVPFKERNQGGTRTPKPKTCPNCGQESLLERNVMQKHEVCTNPDCEEHGVVHIVEDQRGDWTRAMVDDDQPEAMSPERNLPSGFTSVKVLERNLPSGGTPEQETAPERNLPSVDPARIGRPCMRCRAPLIKRLDGIGYEPHECEVTA